jgi:hypothetical protein
VEDVASGTTDGRGSTKKNKEKVIKKCNNIKYSQFVFIKNNIQKSHIYSFFLLLGTPRVLQQKGATAWVDGGLIFT